MPYCGMCGRKSADPGGFCAGCGAPLDPLVLSRSASWNPDAAASAAAAPVEQKDEWDVFLRYAGAKKIPVIKSVMDLNGLGLQDAKKLVDSAPCAVMKGVSRAAAEAAVRELIDAGAIAEVLSPYHQSAQLPAGLRDEWDVFLRFVGEKKMPVIKCVMDLNGRDLQDAKKLVDSVPCTVIKGAPRAAAEAAVRELYDVGAIAEVRSPSGR